MQLLLLSLLIIIIFALELFPYVSTVIMSLPDRLSVDLLNIKFISFIPVTLSQ